MPFESAWNGGQGVAIHLFVHTVIHILCTDALLVSVRRGAQVRRASEEARRNSGVADPTQGAGPGRCAQVGESPAGEVTARGGR
jgi:hypothetical protein